MTKRELIDAIVEINTTAEPSFLARFGDPQLQEYLDHLQVLFEPRLSGEVGRYAKYFASPVALPSQAAKWRVPHELPGQIFDTPVPDNPAAELINAAAGPPGAENTGTPFADTEAEPQGWLF